MWQNENGPNGGDEINILKPGRNYGWPIVSYGRTYQGPWQSSPPGHAGFEAPVVIWIPAIAVSGMTFYTGDKFPQWKGDVFVGSLRTGEIPGTGHLERILFNDKWRSCGARHCCANCASASATFGKVPTDCYIVDGREKGRGVANRARAVAT